MHCDGRCARLLGNFGKLDGVYIAAVKALAELDRHRNGHGPDNAFDYLTGKLRRSHKRRAVAAFDNLTDGAAHVDIQYLRTGVFYRKLCRLRHDLRLVAEYLRRKGVADLGIIQKRLCLCIAVNQRLCADHLGRGERSAHLGAYGSERKIAHPRHRGEGQTTVYLDITYLHHSISSPTGQ